MSHRLLCLLLLASACSRALVGGGRREQPRLPCGPPEKVHIQKKCQCVPWLPLRKPSNLSLPTYCTPPCCQLSLSLFAFVFFLHVTYRSIPAFSQSLDTNFTGLRPSCWRDVRLACFFSAVMQQGVMYIFKLACGWAQPQYIINSICKWVCLP